MTIADRRHPGQGFRATGSAASPDAPRHLAWTSHANEILGIIGPAGSGKTTFLARLNRLNDLVRGSRTEGRIQLDGKDIYGPEANVAELRRKLGMVFATPIALPRSIFENVVFGLRLTGRPGESRAHGPRPGLPGKGGPLGRGQGPARYLGPQPLRRPAAAAVHRPRPGPEAGGDPPRRALLGPRPDLDRGRSRMPSGG